MITPKCLTLLNLLTLAALSRSSAAEAWYDITFTGADLWTYSADNAAQSRTDQAAPRRYNDYTQPAGSETLYTTYGLSGGLPITGFGNWAAESGFTFDSINLWGAGGTGAADWGEAYVSVGNSDPGAEGVRSWKIIQSPPGWTAAVQRGNDPPYSADATHAFPVWDYGTGSTLGLANMNDPSFVFEVQVLISNPDTAFEPDGELRVFFGGYSDTWHGDASSNYEISGVTVLNATLVPEPGVGEIVLLGFALAGLSTCRRRRSR